MRDSVCPSMRLSSSGSRLMSMPSRMAAMASSAIGSRITASMPRASGIALPITSRPSASDPSGVCGLRRPRLSARPSGRRQNAERHRHHQHQILFARILLPDTGIGDVIEGRADAYAIGEDEIDFDAGFEFDMRAEILARTLLVIADGGHRQDQQMLADRQLETEAAIGVDRAAIGEHHADERMPEEKALGEAEFESALGGGIIMEEIESADTAGDVAAELGLGRAARDRHRAGEDARQGNSSPPSPHMDSPRSRARASSGKAVWQASESVVPPRQP